MPRIPLADIPNAPGIGPTPEMQRVPGLRVDMSGITRNLQQSTIRPGSFDGAAEGLAKVGDAVAGVAPVINEFGQRMVASKNYGDLARAEAVMDTARAAHAQETAQLPENQWSAVWDEKYAPMVAGQIEGLGLSQWSKDRIGPQLVQFQARQKITIAHSAWKKSAERDDMAMANQFNAAMDAGDYEKAAAVNQQRTAIGHQTPEEQEKVWAEAEKKIQHRGAIDFQNRDPLNFEAEMEESAAAGKSDVFPWMQPEDIARYMNSAQSEVRSRRTDARQSLHDSILAGEIPDEETLRAKAGPYIGETEIKSLARSIVGNVQYNPEITSKLRTDIANYDPKVDKDLSVYNSLRSRIESTVVKDVQGPLSSELYKVYSDAKEGKPAKPASRLRSALFSTIDTMTEQGLLGPTGTSDKTGEKGKIVDSGQYISSFEKAQKLKDDAEQFFADNPDATPEQATQWFKTTVSGSAAEQAAKAFGEKAKAPVYNWAPYGGGGLGMPGAAPRGKPSIDEIRKKTGPAAIRFNNPGAMYPGPSSEKFGAVATETIGGGHKIAVFPDAESGAAAQFDLLDRSYTGKTLKDAISKWSGGNDVSTYLAVIEKDTGIKGGTVLTKDMVRDPLFAIPLARAMARQESGKEYPLTEAQWRAAHSRAFES